MMCLEKIEWRAEGISHWTSHPKILRIEGQMVKGSKAEESIQSLPFAPYRLPLIPAHFSHAHNSLKLRT